MIDTHTHLNFPDLKADLEGVLARAEAAGVTQFVVPGTTLEDSRLSLELATEEPRIFGCVGLHPCDLDPYGEAEKQSFRDLLVGEKRVVAMGEVGLDYYHFEGLATPQEIEARKLRQQEVFTDMIGMAVQNGLPLIIHSREAFADCHKMLTELAPGHPTVIHCFTGTLEQAKAWLEAGCLISFTAVITYKKNDALREIVRMVPLEKMLLETDSPFLAPEGFRGTRCEPMYVRNVAECVAAVKDISLEEVDRVTTANAKRFFRI